MSGNKSCNCGVCERINLIRQGKNPYFVRELETGYVVIGDHQRFQGYTLFLCKEHATEIHFLEKEFRNRFLQEMSLTAEAVYKAFSPDKLNYELLGVGNNVHMHWHFWQIGAQMRDDRYLPTEEELEDMKKKLNEELSRLLTESGYGKD